MSSVITVTAMAKKVGLSRARFYQLQREGFFPAPLYCLRSHRPYFDVQLQQQCVEVKSSGIGVNNCPIIFYSPRQNNVTTTLKKKASQNTYPKIRETLKQMGIVVSAKEVSDALSQVCPGGISESTDKGEVVRDLFKFFKNGSQNDA